MTTKFFSKDDMLLDMIMNARKIKREPPEADAKNIAVDSRLAAVLTQHGKDACANINLRNIDEYTDHLVEVLSASLRDFTPKIKVD
jgi:hypothetical protein